MGRMATPEEFEEYKSSGLCPYCYAEDVVSDATSVEAGVIRRTKYCSKCELRWTEVWEDNVLTGLYLDDGD
ncbi:MAG: hypothetical protein AB1641_01930 [Thermodesulfobacteriota bacterium]